MRGFRGRSTDGSEPPHRSRLERTELQYAIEDCCEILLGALPAVSRLEITLRFRKSGERTKKKKKIEPSSGGNKRHTVRIRSSSALRHHHLSAYTTHKAGFCCMGRPQRSKEMRFSVIRRGPISRAGGGGRSRDEGGSAGLLREAGPLLAATEEKMTTAVCGAAGLSVR